MEEYEPMKNGVEIALGSPIGAKMQVGESFSRIVAMIRGRGWMPVGLLDQKVKGVWSAFARDTN